MKVIELMVEHGMAPSMSAARRLIAQGAVSIDARKVGSVDEAFADNVSGRTLMVGSKRYIVDIVKPGGQVAGVDRLLEDKRRLVEALRDIRDELQRFADDLGYKEKGTLCNVCDEVDTELPCLHIVVCAAYIHARALLEEMGR